jgi:hypothetical protein
MAWSGIPVSAGDNFLSYGILRQFYKALQERYCASNGSFRFPQSSKDWYDGVVSGITATTLTDSSANYTADWPGSIPTPPYTDSFDVIIDPVSDDEWMVVRTSTSGYASSTMLNISNIEDYVASGRIPSLASLVGKPYVLIVRDGYWWNERWMNWPNGYPTANNLPRMKMETTVGGTTSIQQDTEEWVDDQWIGYDLLINRTSDGRLQRIPITGNSATTLTFDTVASSVSGDFLIVPASATAEINRLPAQSLRFYTGVTQSAVTIKPDEDLVSRTLGNGDGAQTTAYPLLNITRLEGPDCNIPVNYRIKDRDFWSSFDAACRPIDRSYNPNLYKCIRGLQVAALFGGSSFVEMRSYHGEAFIPTLNPARLSRVAGLNTLESVSVTPAGDGSGSATFTLPVGSYGYFYELVGPTGVVAEGESTEATVTFGASTMLVGESYTCYAATGFTRKIPREFRWAYPKKFFVPALDSSSPVDPPTTDFPGLWNDGSSNDAFRTHYKEFDDDGLVTATEAFQTGDLARYSGDNPDDPGLYAFSQYVVDGDRPEGYSQEWPWYKGSIERADPDLGVARLAVMSGTVTSTAAQGGVTWFEESTRNWYGSPLGGGVLRSETGTATSGSSTTLVDTAKIADAFWDASTGRWAGFILEVTRNSGPLNGTVWRTPIVSSVQATGVLTFLAVKSADGDELSVIAGDTYTIREPKWNVSYWKGRTIRLTAPGGVVYEKPILHSDDKRLWFADPAVPVAVGWTYRIVELQVGSVYQWDGSMWVVPSGYGDFDDIGLRGVAPTMKTRYGLMRKGDYAGAWLLNELQDVINELQWTIGPASWTNQSVLGVPELNKLEGDFPADFPADPCGDPPPTYPDPCDDAEAWWDAVWAACITPHLGTIFGATRVADDAAPSTVTDAGKFDDTGGSGTTITYGYFDRWAYPVVNGHNTCLPGSVEVYSIAEAPCDDDPDVEGCAFEKYGTPFVEGVLASVGTATMSSTGRTVLPRIQSSNWAASEPASPTQSVNCDLTEFGDLQSPFDYGRGKLAGYVVPYTVGIYKWTMSYV